MGVAAEQLAPADRGSLNCATALAAGAAAGGHSRGMSGRVFSEPCAVSAGKLRVFLRKHHRPFEGLVKTPCRSGEPAKLPLRRGCAAERADSPYSRLRSGVRGTGQGVCHRASGAAPAHRSGIQGHMIGQCAWPTFHETKRLEHAYQGHDRRPDIDGPCHAVPRCASCRLAPRPCRAPSPAAPHGASRSAAERPPIYRSPITTARVVASVTANLRTKCSVYVEPQDDLSTLSLQHPCQCARNSFCTKGASMPLNPGSKRPSPAPSTGAWPVPPRPSLASALDLRG